MILIYAKRVVYLLYMIIIYRQFYVMSNALIFVFSFVFCPSCSCSNSFDFHKLFISKHNYLLRSCLKFHFYMYDVYSFFCKLDQSEAQNMQAYFNFDCYDNRFWSFDWICT